VRRKNSGVPMTRIHAIESESVTNTKTAGTGRKRGAGNPVLFPRTSPKKGLGGGEGFCLLEKWMTRQGATAYRKFGKGQCVPDQWGEMRETDEAPLERSRK